MEQLHPQSLIRLSNPEVPIYRIFSLWFFEELLRLKQLVLVPPHRWEDPFEVLAHRVKMVDSSTKPSKIEMLSPYLAPAYAQCWSTTRESDTLLRAYSRVVLDPHSGRNIVPRDEGVKVRTTPHKLLLALSSWFKSADAKSCFLGSVKYDSREQILQEIANLIDRHGAVALGRDHLLAELMLLKRSAFSHEAEVRAICIDQQKTEEQPRIQVQVEPNEFIEEVEFDPRLSIFERKEREEVARGLGYHGSFGKSDLYLGHLLEVRLPKGWTREPTT